MRGAVATLAATLMLQPVMGQAAPADAGTNLAVPPAYLRVAEEYQVPAGILFAIALTESARATDDGRMLPWPWALNLEGKAIYFPSRNDADVRLSQLIREGRTPDIGLMQVNWKYHQDKLGSPDQAFDPWLNLRAGARVLRQEYEASGDWWQAVGRYHSRTPARAKAYRARVLRWYRRLG